MMLFQMFLTISKEIVDPKIPFIEQEKIYIYIEVNGNNLVKHIFQNLLICSTEERNLSKQFSILVELCL